MALAAVHRTHQSLAIDGVSPEHSLRALRAWSSVLKTIRAVDLAMVRGGIFALGVGQLTCPQVLRAQKWCSLRDRFPLEERAGWVSEEATSSGSYASSSLHPGQTKAVSGSVSRVNPARAGCGTSWTGFGDG